jgi:small-conductance mechanosensitive channel
VFLVPGYAQWWKYAADSPYYKEYIELQWTYYNKTRERQKKLEQNITWRNILLATMVFMIVLLAVLSLFTGAGVMGILVVAGCVVLSLGASVIIRQLLILAGK